MAHLRSSHQSDNEKSDNGGAAGSQGNHESEVSRKAPLPKRLWNSLGLNLGMVSMMVKGALPPTISIALYQWSAFANHFSTIGYLVAIMATLSFTIMPRAKFVQTMTFNIIAICIGSAMALLQIYCAVQARAHTTSPQPKPTGGAPTPGAQVAPYNSSASAVCAIWLFFNIYVVNLLRASRPQLQFPVIMYNIFTVVASTYAPQFATMTQGTAFAKRLLEAFLTGFGIAVIVSFLVFPLTSRKIVFKEAAGYIAALQGALTAQSTYLQSLEDPDALGSPDKESLEESEKSMKARRGSHVKKPRPSPQADSLKAAVGGVGELHGKLSADMAFAKREIVYGKLDASDLGELLRLLRLIMIPIMGMSSIADIFDRVAERRGWKKTSEGTTEEKEAADEIKDKDKTNWSEIMRSLHDPFETLTIAMNEGLQHALYILELGKPPKDGKRQAHNRAVSESSPDVEAKGNMIKPGDKDFVDHLNASLNRFYDQRQLTLDEWCQQKGVHLGQKGTYDPLQPTQMNGGPREDHQRTQRQLYMILYMEFLLWSTGRAVVNLVKFADLKASQGVMARKRFIFPGKKRLKKWILSSFGKEDATAEHTPDITETTNVNIELGQAYRENKDPEHLPPTNAWQRFGNSVRRISGILASQESAFGFRVAVATMSIGIVAFLEATQRFFIEQRLLWAMIMVSIGMTVTAGAGVFGFIGRITGTILAMCTSLLMWYIVDGKTPGIIVLLFVFTFIEFYFLLKFPKFLIIALLSMVTQVLIVGYELQVRKVGDQIATSNGQPVYPIYELAPYRLACVAGGMLVAFIWTFFPYPLTARSKLRRDLGASLYLLANFYSCVHTTVGMRLNGTEGDLEDKTSPGYKLNKARSIVFSKELALLAGLRDHSSIKTDKSLELNAVPRAEKLISDYYRFTAYEPTFGGKFPRKQYDSIISEVKSILNFMALISYASNILSNEGENDPDKATWLKTFAKLVRSAKVTSHELTSTLSLLSASVVNGNPLPPYLKAPQPYKLSAKLEAMDADILSINHIAEPGYAAFAVMQIATSLIMDDMEKLIANVKELVGEVDFSFHIVSTAASSSETLTNKGKQD